MNWIFNITILTVETQKKFFTILLVLLTSQIYCQAPNKNSSIDSSQQLIIVLTESPNLPDGKLYRFTKDSNSEWKLISKSIPIIVGKNGLAESNGLVSFDNLKLEQKKEGDGKSPAGIFSLTKAFGFVSPTELGDLKFPYLQIEEGTECIDDPNSQYYNNILKPNSTEKIDWESSEKMWKADPWYRFGVIIDANNSPITNGNGSCLFLHNWSGPDDTTAGCTAMQSKVMKEIVLWLDSAKNPLLVQLTKVQYNKNQEELGLPKIK